MGFIQYTVGNGALFTALKYLTSTAGSLVYCLIPLASAGLELVWLKDRRTGVQWTGALGSALFFAPGVSGAGSLEVMGLLVLTSLCVATFGVLLRGSRGPGRGG